MAIYKRILTLILIIGLLCIGGWVIKTKSETWEKRIDSQQENVSKVGRY